MGEEMEYEESIDLKPLYAHLKRIKIGRFLFSNEFKLLTIEWKIDNLWAECKKQVSRKKTFIVVGINVDYDYFEEAFYVLLSAIYLNCKFELFEDILLKTLFHFAKNSKGKIIFNDIIESLVDLEDFNEDKKKEFKKAIKKIYKLKPIDNYMTSSLNPTSTIEKNNKIFIVHGHNIALKESVARMLTQIQLTPVILHEQVNNGKTIIEKFELHSDVGYAIVLLTGDDFIETTEGTKKPRARQNVILEWGYFIGKLGRNRVASIYQESVELPSDLGGLLYILYDNEDAWKYKLIKELKSAGFNVDANQI